jgi:hypothetical protein
MAPKHEFWVQWSGSGAFVSKNSDTTSFSELVRLSHQFGPFCVDFRVVTKRFEMAPKHVLGPMEWIGLVHCEKFLHKLILWTCALMAPVRPVLHRVSCSNEKVRNAPKTWGLDPMEWIGLPVRPLIDKFAKWSHMKVGAKRADLVPLIDKFAKWSCVGIFRNEST